MLHIQKFVVNMIQENCYVVNDETLEAVIVDDGAYYHEEKLAIENYINENGLHPVLLLDTHAHFDHIMGNKALYDRYGLKARFSRADAALYDGLKDQARLIMGFALEGLESAPAGPFVSEGDVLTFGSHRFSVIATPGHTPGGLCFYCKEENVLFSGDSLFHGSIGRTDLPGGDTEALVNSLKTKILTLPEPTRVLTGHGPATDVLTEKKINPYLN